MRVAAIYDIHGNLPALDAVLREIERIGVDEIIVGGDVLPGPEPRETLDRLWNLDTPIRFIVGNGDREVITQRLTGSTTAPERSRDVIRWTAEQLGDDDVRLIAAWPETLDIEMPKIGRVLFCHATPRNDTEIFSRLTPEAKLIPVFAASGARVVVCGHTHMQFDRKVGDTRVVNAGSVGMPFGSPGAYWLLLDDEVRLQQTMYDLEDAAQRIRTTSFPGADAFATAYILNTPTEEAILDIYAKAELTA